MYQKMGSELKEILNLEREPVAIKWSLREPNDIKKETEPSRFCTKLDKASTGEIFYSTVEEESCMGGLRYSGMKYRTELPKNVQSGSFLVPAGVYKSVPAVQRSWQNNKAIDAGIFSAILFAPLIKANFSPDIVFIISNSEQAMMLLHANAYDSGSHGLGADSGPICSSMAAIPYLTGKVTYGFGDIGSRNNMELKPDDVMVTIPGTDLERILANLKDMQTKTFFKKN